MSLLTDARRPTRLAPDTMEPEAPPGGAEPNQPASGGQRWASLLVLAALVLLGAATLFTLNRVFADPGWIGPVATTALGVAGLAIVMRLPGVPPLVAMAVCLVGVAALGTGTALGLSAFDSFPNGTWHLVINTVEQARAAMPSAVTPVATAPGFELLAAWAAGIVVLLGDWGAFRMDSPTQAVAPYLVLFLLCSVLGGPRHRTLDLAVWLAATLVYLLVHHYASSGPGAVAFGGVKAKMLRPNLTGVAIGMAAMAVGLSLTPLLAAHDGSGLLGWRNGSTGQGTRVVESPIVDLRTRIVKEHNVPVFTVKSSQPSYWRLTSLDEFNGSLWTSTDSYQEVHGQLPTVGPSPSGASEVTETFHIEKLDSIWLPVAFDPQSVSGAGTLTYDPISGSLLTPEATSNNLTYTVTSYQRLATLNPTALRSTGEAPASDSSLPNFSQYLQLPGDIPPSVVRLAQRITAGKITEYDKALALQNYLLGPMFTYSTSPPTDGFDTSALATFLTKTMTGYCQQFAGSYAVLARIVGIPTRLAVGFATGSSVKGVYHVVDGDAHTWPEVWFPKYGWVPFEPTKGNFAIPGASYTGASFNNTPAPPPSTPSATPTPSKSPSAAAKAAKPVPSPNTVPSSTQASGGGFHPGAPLVIAALAVILLLVAWPLLTAAARQLRWSRRRSRLGRGQGGALLASWQEITERLAWRGVRKTPDETSAEYARRAEAELGPLLEIRRVSDVGGAARAAAAPTTLATLADAVNEARFSEGQLAPGQASEALAVATELQRALRSKAPLALHLRWWLDPRSALSARRAGSA